MSISNWQIHMLAIHITKTPTMPAAVSKQKKARSKCLYLNSLSLPAATPLFPIKRYANTDPRLRWQHELCNTHKTAADDQDASQSSLTWGDAQQLCVLDKFERVRIQWNILKRTLRSMRQNYKMQRRNTLEIIAIANKLTAVQGPYAADLENVLPLPHTPYYPSPPPTPHPAPIKGEKIK